MLSNRTAVDIDLNEASLLNAQIAVRTNFRDIAGLKILARARKLVIAPGNEPTAIRLTKTELRPGTADNDVSILLGSLGS